MKTITEIAESDCGSQADNEFWEITVPHAARASIAVPPNVLIAGRFGDCLTIP